MESYKWVRSENGAIFGVCKGLAEGMGLSVGLVRALWILSTLFLGVGFGLYILLALSLPRRDRLYQAYQSKILGVCAYISRRSQVEVGIIRFVALILLFASMGLTFVAYLIGYFSK
jgi:phage shock protein C